MGERKGGRRTLAEERGTEDDPTIMVAVKMTTSMRAELKRVAKSMKIKLPDFMRLIFEQAIRSPPEINRDQEEPQDAA